MELICIRMRVPLCFFSGWQEMWKGGQNLQSGWLTHPVDKHICWCRYICFCPFWWQDLLQKKVVQRCLPSAFLLMCLLLCLLVCLPLCLLVCLLVWLLVWLLVCLPVWLSSHLGLQSSSSFSCLHSILFRQKVVFALIFLYFDNDNM